MAWPYDEEDTLGAYGSASQVPTGEWFGVDTRTGEWQRPGSAPTLASSAGMPDVNAPPVWGGTPDQAPLAIGQVAGGVAPALGPQPRLARMARASEQGLLPEQPTMWGSIARSLAMASPTGKSILQGFDQQQQQQLTNRLALRRQQLLEEQESRQATQTSLETLRKISEMPNKTMRNLMFDRYVADMSSSGQPLPGDMVEAFKKSSLDEGKQMAQMLTPMFEAAGIDPTTASQILQEGGDPKRLLEMIDMGLKAKKQKADEAEEARLTQSRQTLFGASTGAGATTTASGTSTTPPTTPTTPAPTTRAGTIPPEIDTAVTEATQLYPQVRRDLVHGIIRHESNYDVGAVSPKGAMGPMQLMPGTAKDMGVDPKDPVQNIRGGTRYFAQLLTKYNGNEALALAAYNWGPGNVDKVGGDLTKMPAETQAYVKNVLGTATSGQRGPAGTQGQVAGPGAPAQDQAQLTRLNQQIAAMDQFLAANIGSGRERTKGMVNEVQQERTRLIQEREKLLEPQRAYERERLQQPLKKEVAEAGERVRAENERATKEEIDAVNRLRPADKKVPYGTTRAQLREMGAVGASELPQTVMEGFTDRASVVRLLGELSTKVGNLPTGPWASRVEAFRQTFGIDVKDEAVAYRTVLAGVHNQLALARGGKALTPQEISRIEKELPTERDPDPVFRQKLKTAQKMAEDIYRLKAQFYKKAGYGVPDELMSPYEPAGLDTQEGKDLLGEMKRGTRPK